MTLIADLDAQGGLISAALKDRKIRSLVLSRLTEQDIQGVDRHLFRVVTSGSKILPGVLPKEADERLQKVESTLMVMPEMDDVQKWLRSIEEKTALRKQRELLLRGLESIDQGARAEDVSASLLSGMASLMTKINLQTTYTAADVVSAGRAQVDQWLAGDPFAGLVPTYIKPLDDALGGLVPGHVTTIGARPSMAKTVLGLQIMRNTALKIISDKRDAICVFVSLDMTPTMLGFRIASSLSGVNWKDIRTKSASADDTASWLRHHDALKDWPIVIKKMPAPTAGQVMNSIEMEAAGHKDGVALIVVDFIEMMTGEGSNETAQVGNIMKGIKVIAERFNCPVVALSQLSREVEKTSHRTPEKQHLRQSGMIEAVSEQVILLYYPAGYQTKVQAQRGEWPNKELRERAEGLAKLGANYLAKIEKNRDDEAGIGVPLLFEPKYTRFGPPCLTGSTETKKPTGTSFSSHTAKDEDLLDLGAA
jgi:replicative DNA helicase